ncbi:MAG: GatB/YqeY domain-containing protein, partial [Oscillospiraceae bacterium]|nr:GatB/YqeY domain-containing protein [Oscillospiraceae bacterium]
MSKIDEVRSAMMKAMKDKNKPRKDALSMLLSALKAKFIDKRADLTEEEENTIILREIKQAQETLESAPADKTDMIEECKLRIAVYSEFAPKMMNEQEIKEVVKSVLDEMGLENPTVKEKGLIMKNLMPKVKGKADGGLVNKIV